MRGARRRRHRGRIEGLLFDVGADEAPLDRDDDAGDELARGRELRAQGASVDAHLRRVGRDRYGDGKP